MLFSRRGDIVGQPQFYELGESDEHYYRRGSGQLVALPSGPTLHYSSPAPSDAANNGNRESGDGAAGGASWVADR